MKHVTAVIGRIRIPLLIAFAITLILSATPALGQTEYGTPVPGQHIYDRAGLLTPDEIATLERHAAAVEQAGAPVVVYLQARDADYDETYRDAQLLMEVWDVQSAPDARDGVVLFFNLKPNNLRRGEVVIYAGETHYQDGNLPERELKRIFEQEMRPRLRDDQTAEGIAAGLDGISHALTFGPPPPPPPSSFEKVAARATDGALSIVNILGVGLGALLFFFGFNRFKQRPQAQGAVIATTMPPDNRPPAVAGALVNGRIDDNGMTATLLDLAQRGALAFEPDEEKMQLRLIDKAPLRHSFEHVFWRALEARADADGIVSAKNIGKLHNDWEEAKAELRKQLEAEGLFQPNPSERRMPLYLLGILGLLIGGLGLIFVAVSEAALSAIGLATLAGASLLSLIFASSITDLTDHGAREALPWRGYKEGITKARKDKAAVLDLNVVVPYAVAFGAVSALDEKLQEASDEGFIPIWLGPSMAHHPGWHGGFYLYWMGFHGSLSSGGSGSVSVGGGGAAAGGGGAGGSF